MDKLKLRELSKNLLEVHREIHGIYSDYARSVGLTLAGLEVLLIIWDEKECSQNKIVQKSFVPKQTVNAIIQKLIKEEIIELSVEDSDKRNKIIRYTEKGLKYVTPIVSNVQNLEYKALDSLGFEKQQQLLNIIILYKNSLKAELK